MARHPILGVMEKTWETDFGSIRRSGTFFWVTTTQELEPRMAIPVRPEAVEEALKAYSIW